MVSIDINCDMGEGCANDAALMDHVTSVNIACGYHAGDRETMQRTVETAIKKGVAIGAHPGYRDRENFGRTAMNLSSSDVQDLVTEQIAALSGIAHEAGGKLAHVKPHGALYNQSANDPGLASAIANAVVDIDANLILFGLSGSHSITEARKVGLKTASEVFADRTYQPDGSLTPRSQPRAMIEDDATALAQVLQMVLEQTVTAANGDIIAIKADTVCIHGDGPRALEFAKAIRAGLASHHISVVSI